MKEQIVVIGLGEMGSIFARGFLKLGHPVFPVTRKMNIADTPKASLVLVAVAENDLQKTIQTLPTHLRSNAVLLQNELLPCDWENQLDSPTVISVWFEKKKGQESKVIIPSPVYGSNAHLIQDALATLDIPCCVLNSREELLFELVRKNVYILTTNIAGLVVGGNVGELWHRHRDLAEQIAKDVLKIQEKLTGNRLDPEAYIQGMVEAFEGDPAHKCMGRSAPQRLARALQQARDRGVDTPTLNAIKF